MFNSLEDIEILDGDKILGEGTFSTVLKIINKNDKKVYALKKIHFEELHDQDKENIKQEIKLHRNLNHPNIIKFYDAIYVENNLYLMLEHADNGSLYFYINSHQGLPEKLALRFFYQIALAVKYLHSQELIHRDIKPENVLLDANFNAKLCDFGWACISDQNTFRTSICGTCEYMSPEIVKEGIHNNKVDIWCLGIFLYEMLHGSPPFAVESAEELKEAFNKKIPLDSSLSSSTLQLLKHLLKMDFRKRFTIDQILMLPIFFEIKKDLANPIPVEYMQILIANYKNNVRSDKRDVPLVLQEYYEKNSNLKNEVDYYNINQNNDFFDFNIENRNFINKNFFDSDENNLPKKTSLKNIEKGDINFFDIHNSLQEDITQQKKSKNNLFFKSNFEIKNNNKSFIKDKILQKDQIQLKNDLLKETAQKKNNGSKITENKFKIDNFKKKVNLTIPQIDLKNHFNKFQKFQKKKIDEDKKNEDNKKSKNNYSNIYKINEEEETFQEIANLSIGDQTLRKDYKKNSNENIQTPKSFKIKKKIDLKNDLHFNSKNRVLLDENNVDPKSFIKEEFDNEDFKVEYSDKYFKNKIKKNEHFENLVKTGNKNNKNNIEINESYKSLSFVNAKFDNYSIHSNYDKNLENDKVHNTNKNKVDKVNKNINFFYNSIEKEKKFEKNKKKKLDKNSDSNNIFLNNRNYQSCSDLAKLKKNKDYESFQNFNEYDDMEEENQSNEHQNLKNYSTNYNNSLFKNLDNINSRRNSGYITLDEFSKKQKKNKDYESFKNYNDYEDMEEEEKNQEIDLKNYSTHYNNSLFKNRDNLHYRRNSDYIKFNNNRDSLNLKEQMNTERQTENQSNKFISSVSFRNLNNKFEFKDEKRDSIKSQCDFKYVVTNGVLTKVYLNEEEKNELYNNIKKKNNSKNVFDEGKKKEIFDKTKNNFLKSFRTMNLNLNKSSIEKKISKKLVNVESKGISPIFKNNKIKKVESEGNIRFKNYLKNKLLTKKIQKDNLQKIKTIFGESNK